MLRGDSVIEAGIDGEFLKTLTILYVEDEDDIFEQVVKLLSKRCMTLLTARNGLEGLEAYRSHTPDIILTDINMPIMDGLTMAEEIHTIDFSVPIIVMTAFEKVSLLKQAISIGIHTYLTKPVSRNELSGKLLDCAHRLRIEHDLKKSTDVLRKLEQAIKQCSSAIVITDKTGVIEFVNKSYTELTGYRADELVGQNPRLLKSRNTPHETYAALWGAVTRGKAWGGELQNIRKDGSLFWVTTVISPIYGEGEISHFIATQEDISEKKQLTEMLVHSQKVESIGQLAGGMAHNLNNTLCVINGYAALMKIADDLTPAHKNNVKKIMEASAQASALTHSMLAYSHKQVLKQKVQNINELVTKTGEFIRHLIRTDIEFTCTLSEVPLLVNVDGGQLEQVLMNMSTNARDAMPDGGVLHISVVQGVMNDQDTDRLTKPCAIISVTDNGSGMDEEIRKRVFDPFFTTKEVGKGTGLGMAMVFGIIRQHGGYIDVQSEPGAGTKFSLYLPLVSHAMAASLSDEAEVGCARVQKKQRTILVVDEDDTALEMLRRLLTRVGYRVITAHNGKEAVETFRGMKDAIHLVISDMLQEAGGNGLYEGIRSLSQAVPFIYLTNHPFDVVTTSGEQDGCDVFIKPLRPAQLLGRIDEII